MSKHEKLCTAVQEAMAAQNFTQKQVATFAGISSSMISTAFNQGIPLKEERWRMICEGLALDYDAIVDDTSALDDTEAPAAAPSGGGEDTVNLKDETPELVAKDTENHTVGRYLLKHLEEDVRHGTDMPLIELRDLLNAAVALMEE